MRGRKGDYFFHWWAEIFSLLTAGFGYVVGWRVHFWLFAFLVVFIMGLFFGRLLWEDHSDDFIPILIISAAFVIGFVVGNITVDDITAILVYGLAMSVSYHLHKEHYVLE